MDELIRDDKPIAVNTTGANVVYAVPAKPKKKPPWWSENFGGLLIVGWCFVMVVIVLFG